MAILGKNGDFRSRLEHANGFLLPKDDVETAARADKVVQQLAALLVSCPMSFYLCGSSSNDV